MENKNIGLCIQTGLDTLNSKEVKVSASEIENLANFKSILKAVLRGELVIATPDRILPDGVELPIGKEDSEED